MPIDNKHPKPSAQLIIQALQFYGVEDVFISPGTRNTPLITACDKAPLLRKHIVVDERCAAFMALGMAAVTGNPIAIICTSGSAMLNYAPAIAEAYYRHIPLIIITADRPVQWIDQADSQTIRQPGALSNIVKKTSVIPEFYSDDITQLRYCARVCADAIVSAIRTPQAPVHINIPFDLPLSDSYPSINSIHFPTVINSTNCISDKDAKKAAFYAAGKDIMIVCGQYPENASLENSLAKLARLSNIVVVAENTANLHSDDIITTFDEILHTDKLPKPQLVIVMGGALVSARLKSCLRSLSTVDQWHVAPYSDQLQDTFHTLSTAIESDPAIFFGTFSTHLAENNRLNNSIFSQTWHKTLADSRSKRNKFIDSAPWSELKAMRHIISHIPCDYNLHISNGTAIRYAQLFETKKIHGLWCNRGVSGIDGCTSTAIGAAMAYSKPTMLITGDMSAAYDISALSQKHIPANFKIILLNNAGGGIFRAISKTASLPQRDEYLCIAPKLPMKQIAEAYGFRYLNASSETELKESFKSLISDGSQPSILELHFDPETSANIFKEYFKN